ncbi:hypothetical protein [Maribacter sp. ACAM166]|uniref:hypothetical protein n=1 Tax=Maribacter sp. ACAM166 TaxID=2508996 RepID=UPI0010FD0DB0|nr:hypothetical protein [Maribacter sp. ACAM166]TLP80533.1 hypothetical protein ES765_07105 [Maribacter sp. ACAM166]
MKGLLKVVLKILKSIIPIGYIHYTFLASCKGQHLNNRSNVDAMQLIVQDNYGGSKEEEFLVFKDQASLTDFFEILIEQESSNSCSRNRFHKRIGYYMESRRT